MQTVVVVGGGYAGLSACLELARRTGRRDVDHDMRLFLVNEEAEHTYTTELHSLAVGVDDPDDVLVPLHHVLRSPARLMVGRADAVDTSRRSVYVDDESLDYDHLILAVGSVPEDYGIAGVRRYARFLTSAASAEALQERLDRVAERGFGNVVLVGAGLTGIELAAEIKDVYKGRLEVLLLEAGDTIMAGIDPALQRASQRLLEAKGVHVRTGIRIEEVDSHLVSVRGKADVPYDVLVWCAGVRGNPLLARSGFSVEPRGRGLTDAYLRAHGRQDVWLAGDCAAFPMPSGGFLAPTAQAAEQAGRAVAKNVLRAIAGQEPEPFEPRVRGFFASLGEWEGVGQVGREEFFGLPAILVKRLIEAQHAFEAGGLHNLTRRLWRHGGRLLWGAAMGEDRFEARLRARPSADDWPEGLGATAEPPADKASHRA
jgi:NADH:ubiquinone reductase (H+-translocating)